MRWLWLVAVLAACGPPDLPAQCDRTAACPEGYFCDAETAYGVPAEHKCKPPCTTEWTPACALPTCDYSYAEELTAREAPEYGVSVGCEVDGQPRRVDVLPWCDGGMVMPYGDTPGAWPAVVRPWHHAIDGACEAFWGNTKPWPYSF